MVQTWNDVITTSLRDLWFGVMNFLPNLLGAIVILVVGLIVAAGLGALVQKIFESVKLDVFLAKIGLPKYFERAGMHLRGAYFLSRLVYWFLVIAFLVAAVQALGLGGAAHFLGNLTWWAIILFGFVAALDKLGIGTSIINALVIGVVGMLALAGGLA